MPKRRFSEGDFSRAFARTLDVITIFPLNARGFV
jgi:hypothetical protein